MKKDSIIEIYRFLACAFIMMGHCIMFGNIHISVPFTVSYQFVEFFFILTGYFTARHFAASDYKNTKVIDVIMYDIRKFKRFLPFTIPAIICIYVEESIPYIQQNNMPGFFNNLKESFFEVFLISALKPGEDHLFVMWFLSAMFVTLPIIIAFCLINSKWIKIILGTMMCGLYYVFIPDYTSHDFPNQLLRAIFGMLIGVVIYYVASMIKGKRIPKAVKIMLSVVFVFAYLLPIYLSYSNYFYRYTYIICFVIWILIVMSDLLVIGPLHSKVGEFLGALSMPIFIWHQVIIDLLTDYVVIDNEVLKLILCFVLTIIVSLANMYIVKGFAKLLKNRKNEREN